MMAVWFVMTYQTKLVDLVGVQKMSEHEVLQT